MESAGQTWKMGEAIFNKIRSNTWMLYTDDDNQRLI